MHSVSRSDLTYHDYLKIPELLSLQKPLSSPQQHDELLFITIHQAYELWFKLILHELETAIETMGEKNILRAHHFIHRTVQIMKHLVQQIHLLETMTPADFLAFRQTLAPASGFQSVQFREIEFIAGLRGPEAQKYLTYFENRPDLVATLRKRLASADLKSTYYNLLFSLGFDLPQNAAVLELEEPEAIRPKIIQGILPIYQNPSNSLPLYLLSESLVEFDEYFALWREHHVRVVERIIGSKPGTGGSPGVEYLRSTTSKKCFPALWELRAQL